MQAQSQVKLQVVLDSALSFLRTFLCGGDGNDLLLKSSESIVISKIVYILHILGINVVRSMSFTRFTNFQYLLKYGPNLTHTDSSKVLVLYSLAGIKAPWFMDAVHSVQSSVDMSLNFEWAVNYLNIVRQQD